VKVLVLGASGFLGSYLGFALQGMGHEVFGVARRPVPYFPYNTVATDLNDVAGVIHSGGHDLVINAIAVASHENCEEKPDTAEEVNAVSPGLWASTALEAGSRFVHISTDAVFDGASSDLYVEEDATNPESVYGITKVRGERSVLAANPEALVLRVNFFGWSQSGLSGILDFFVSAFTHQTPITGFQDYVVSSLYVGDLVEGMMGLVERDASGIFHLVSSTPLSKYDFGRIVARSAGLSVDSMAAGVLGEAKGLAPRGHNLSLSTAKIEGVLGNPMPSTEAGVRRALAERDALMDYFGASEK
jgi:dTDP-4-dehydrorhamnose reductase